MFSLAQEGEELPVDLVGRLGLQEMAVLAQVLVAHLGEHLPH